jgi:hypothetical protein
MPLLLSPVTVPPYTTAFSTLNDTKVKKKLYALKNPAFSAPAYLITAFTFAWFIFGKTTIAVAQTGAALNFDGTNDYVVVPHNATFNFTSNFTLSMWFKPNSTGQTQKYLMGKGNSYAIIYEFVDNQVEFSSNAFTGDNPRTNSQMPLADVLWHHITYTYDGATLKGYMDGIQVVSQPKAFTLTANALDMYIGAANPLGNYVGGSIDEFRVWNRALTAGEIQTSMSCSIPTTNTGLLLNYHFNQGTAGSNNAGITSLTDASGNNYNGTLTNFALTGFTSNWVAPGAQIEINVQGNLTNITDGDNIPSPTDHTDFGNVGNSNSLIRTFTIQNTGTANLNISSITISGANAALFTVGGLSPASPIPPGNSATFTVTFSPGTTGLKTATVNIANADCDEATYDFAVQGTGVPPTLGTYSSTTIANAGGNATVTPSAAPTNAPSITASASTNFKGVLQVNPITGVVTIINAQPAGTYTVTVRASTVTSTFTLTINNPLCSQGMLSGTTNASVGSGPYTVAIGDFNGDGKQDLATANLNVNTVSIRLGDGLGGFSGTTNVNVGSLPYSVSIGDFNGDGKQDLATANFNSNTLSIRLGDGTGNFSGFTEIPVGNSPISVTTGDFNGDGKQDLATANFISANISIRLGDGTGNFSGATEVNVGANPYSIAVGDFNGDTKQDLATANAGSGTVSVRLGDGLGGFSGSAEVSVGSSPYSVTVGDFNGDGKQDLAAANFFSNTVSVRLGDGTGSFSGTTEIATGNGPSSVAIGDFNGDGKQDIAAANDGNNSVSIRLGDGTGNFSGTIEVSAGTNPRSVVIGDFNSDGRQDFAAANLNSDNVSIRLGIDNEINVQGNTVSIADGDNTPSLSDHTNFGGVAIGNTIVRTFTIQNTGNADLTVSSISITGANSSLFTAGALTPASPILPGNSASFTVTFAPTTEGLKTATVIITNNDCTEAVYDFAIQGSTCPSQVTLVSTADDYASGTQLKIASAVNGNITATNKITGSAQVTYQAKVIELKAGFQATGGTVFLAQIGGCN